MNDRTLLALALRNVNGLGRVGVSRLLHSFDSYSELMQCPYEQLLVRLKGVPGAAAIVEHLHNESAMSDLVDQAEKELGELKRRRVTPLVPGHADWPKKLATLPNRFAPVVLYCFGSVELLSRSSVAFIVDRSLRDHEFELLQEVARFLLAAGINTMSGIESGLDVVLAKLASDEPSAEGRGICVADCGLANIAGPVRPTVSQVVKSGGLLVSSFDMTHGPFDHDFAERVFVQAALAGSVVVCADLPEADSGQSGHPMLQLLDWCRSSHTPVFGVGDRIVRPDVHPLNSPGDFDWILAAVQTTRAES